MPKSDPALDDPSGLNELDTEDTWLPFSRLFRHEDVRGGGWSKLTYDSIAER